MTTAISARWADASHRGIILTVGGETRYAPDDMGNSDRRMLAELGVTIAEPPAPTLAEAKAAKLAALADRRWRAEIAGTIVNGMSVPSDEKTQAKLTAAVVASVLDNTYSVQWKLADGSFALFDHATLISVAQAVRAHVQACFDREAMLAAQITAAADATALAAIDLEAWWPA